MDNWLRVSPVVQMILGAAPGLFTTDITQGAERTDLYRFGVFVIPQPVKGRRKRLFFCRCTQKLPEPTDALKLVLV
jgi:hypothetical protein